MNRSPKKSNTVKDNPPQITQSTIATPTTDVQASRKKKKFASKSSTKSLNKQSSVTPVPTNQQQKPSTVAPLTSQKSTGIVSISGTGTNMASKQQQQQTTSIAPATSASTLLSDRRNVAGGNTPKTTSATSMGTSTSAKRYTNRYNEFSKEVKQTPKETSRKEFVSTRSLSRSMKPTQPKPNLDEQNNKKSDPLNDTAKSSTERKATPQKANTLRSAIPRSSTSTASQLPLKSTSVSPKRSNAKSDRDANGKKEEAVPDASVTVPKVLSNAGDQDNFSIKETRKGSSSNIKANSFDSLEKRLSAMQSEFWKTLNNMQRTTPEQIKDNYKFVAIVRNDHGELMIHNDDRSKAPAKLPANSIKDFKDKLKSVIECTMNNVVETYKNHPMFDKSAMDKLRSSALHQLYDIVSEVSSTEKAYEDVAKLHKELQDAQKAVTHAEMKLNEAQKVHEDKIREMEKAKCEIEAQYKTQILELKKTIKQLEFQKNAELTDKKNVEDELKTAKISMSNLTKKVKEYESTLKKDKEDLKQKNVIIENMSREISDNAAKINELKMKQKVCINHAQQIQEYQNEIKELKEQITQLMEAKAALEEELQSVERVDSAEAELLNKLNGAENRIAELQKVLEGNKQIPQISHKDNQLEISKLKQSEAEKRREIEKLKIELSKAQYNIGQLEEQIQRDQKLLDVRSKLINSLQTNDKDQRLHVEELYAKVGEKNSAINELNNELRAKTEEFRNLFSTVSAKQMELSNQEHMIKLLEESNERSQMLRVKQEEKIARMEEEMAHLKQTIETYERNKAATEEVSPRKSALFASVSSDELSDDTCYYFYTTHRKRKRQVDITVRKYEV